jgi:hypothetical protein
MLELTGVDQLFHMHPDLDDWLDGRSNGHSVPIA